MACYRCVFGQCFKKTRIIHFCFREEDGDGDELVMEQPCGKTQWGEDIDSRLRTRHQQFSSMAHSK